MRRETAVLLAVGAVSVALATFAIHKKKPELAGYVMSLFSVTGLIYALMSKAEVSAMKVQMGLI